MKIQIFKVIILWKKLEISWVTFWIFCDKKKLKQIVARFARVMQLLLNEKKIEKKKIKYCKNLAFQI